MEERIRMAMLHQKVTQQTLGDKLGMSRSSFNQKLKRDTWTYSELCEISSYLGCEFKCIILCPDGRQF